MLQKILKSWADQGRPQHTVNELLEWVQKRNNELSVHISPNRLSESGFWFYDASTGCIANKNRIFFQICGIRNEELEQPIILQNEIGFLGLLCREIGGTLHFLMQAKIEPGNINHVQISPTLQATKSNFTQSHGGAQPPYLEYFLQAGRNTIIVDQVQSEQASRFYKKRNRNMVVYTTGEVEVLPSHCWMTLGQIKQFMRYDNLVNMDTRTVLSCLPFSLMPDKCESARQYFRDQSFYNSIFNHKDPDVLLSIYSYFSNYKMFHANEAALIRLDELSDWKMDDWGIRNRQAYSFSVIYCDIAVEGREVQRWTQPLIKAEGTALFGLYTSVRNGIREFLVKIQPEIGCIDQIELGPTVQREAAGPASESALEQAFIAQYARRESILYDVMLSEEGGRFYQEQNRNVILETDYFDPPEGCFWADFRTLNLLIQSGGYLNIQLRNLLALLEV